MTQQRYAYLIGANGPEHTDTVPLKYAEQDVERLHQALVKYPCQFYVQSVIANSPTEVMQGLELLAYSCQSADLLLVHFAGHAKKENEELYLICNRTAFPQRSRMLISTTIKISDIKDVLDRCRARHRLLVLDCCYSGTALSGGAWRGMEEIETALEQLKGSANIILTAGSHREKARELDTLNNGQGAGFLSWAITSACTDQFSAVAREDALSLTDICGWLPVALDLVNKDLPQHEQVPRPRLLNDRVLGIDDEIWFTSKRRNPGSSNFNDEQRQREELAILQQEDYLQQYCYGAKVDEFDRTKVQEYARMQSDSEQLPMQDMKELCRSLGLTSGQYTPRRSSVLAFHRMPSRYLHSALVRVIMRGISSEESYLREEIEGSLSEQVTKTIKWLTSSLHKISENVDAGQRIDRCEIPERALRELVVNAILHRDYTARESVRIEITPDQVIITNPGRLNPAILRADPPFSYRHSHPQNPALLRVLVAQKWAEGHSRGFEIVREEFEKYHLPLPEISNLSNGLVCVTIQRPDISAFSTPKTIETLPVQSSHMVETSPTIWDIPYPRNPYFIGREELLSQLAHRLSGGYSVALSQAQALSGLGGIGKTQLALEYAYRYHEAYRAVLWVRAGTQESLNTDFAELARRLDLPEKDNQDQTNVVKAVLRWLNTHTGWLLILDNADDLQLVRQFLPSQPGGHILLTTRALSTGRLAQRLMVDELDSEQGAIFLLRRAGILSPEESENDVVIHDMSIARDIVQAMGGLPLAVDQAGAYIEETQCSLDDYLRLYQTQRASLLNERGGLVPDHPEPVSTTWSLSFAKVEQASTAAADLLRFCAFLHPDAIPEELFTDAVPQLGSHIGRVRENPLALNETITTLLAYSLMRRNSATNTLSMHRLVQAVLIDKMTEREASEWAERAVRAINQVFPDATAQNREQDQRYLAHAQECANWINIYNLLFPEAARLLEQVALIHEQMYTELPLAEKLLLQALHIREQLTGREHQDTAQTLNFLADLYHIRGDYDRAEQFYKDALDIRRRILGDEHVDVAQSHNNLGLFYANQGQAELAIDHYQEALRILEQRLGLEDPIVAVILNNLAAFYNAQGNYTEAEPMYERALKIREKQLGEEHPDTAISLNNLAGSYVSQQKYQDAERLYKRALEIREQVLGAEHPEVAVSLSNLAWSYLAQREYAKAKPLYQRALEVFAKTLGAEHSTTISTSLSYKRLLEMQEQQIEKTSVKTYDDKTESKDLHTHPDVEGK